MRIQLLRLYTGQYLIRKSLKYVFRSERQPWMGCPEKVGTA